MPTLTIGGAPLGLRRKADTRTRIKHAAKADAPASTAVSRITSSIIVSLGSPARGEQPVSGDCHWVDRRLDGGGGLIREALRQVGAVLVWFSS